MSSIGPSPDAFWAVVSTIHDPDSPRTSKLLRAARSVGATRSHPRGSVVHDVPSKERDSVNKDVVTTGNPRSLLGTLYAFYLEHQRCGELNGGVNDERVWMTCSCGGVISRAL